MFFSDETQYSIDRDTMSSRPGTSIRNSPFLCWLLVFLFCMVLMPAVSGQQATGPQPVLSLNFNEGSGNVALDASGISGSAAIVGAYRADSGCGRSLIFDGSESYVSVPYSPKNHSPDQVSVSLWFFTDVFSPGTLISSYKDGGYRLGFDDGGDLWWTVNIEGTGDVSVPVRHDGISVGQWHHVTGTYDGNTSKIYLDGVLRNQAGAPGIIHYAYDNNIIIGTDAGTNEQPDAGCRRYFRGGIDEVKIYDVALTQGEVIDDRFQCAQEPGTPPVLPMVSLQETCNRISGSLTLDPGQSAVRVLSFENTTENGTWTVTVVPGSTLVVRAQDQYSKTDPDAWYIDISGPDGRINRGVAFPNTNNAPVSGVVNKGNATVLIKYFDGPGRFPASVAVQFESIVPPKKEEPVSAVLNNPIIVIYSASWATLIALILVMVGLHLKHKSAKK